MLTHHALKLLKCRTGLTNSRRSKLIENWYELAVNSCGIRLPDAVA